MLESNLEDDVVKWAEAEGGRALKLKIENERGFPDRTIILPGGRIAIPELKRPKRNKRSRQQIEMVAWLQVMGIPSAFCETIDDVYELFSC